MTLPDFYLLSSQSTKILGVKKSFVPIQTFRACKTSHSGFDSPKTSFMFPSTSDFSRSPELQVRLPASCQPCQVQVQTIFGNSPSFWFLRAFEISSDSFLQFFRIMGIAKTSMSDSPSQIFRSVLPQVWGLYLGLRRKTPCGISFGDKFLSQFCTQGIKKVQVDPIFTIQIPVTQNSIR